MRNHLRDQRRWTRRNPDYQSDYYRRVRNDFYLYFRKKYTLVKARCLGQSPQCRDRYEGMKFMSRDEWMDFVFKSREILEPMFDAWRFSGFQIKLTPSIDRIDPDGGYVTGNVRWLTHAENSSKRRNARRLKP